MAGGSGCEWYFGYKYPDNDLTAEDFRSRERMWNQTRHAVAFFRHHLPFAAMRHADDAVTNRGAYCLAKPGEVYAIYLPTGGTTGLELPDGEYAVRWYDPRDGGDLQRGTLTSVRGGGIRSLGEAPRDTGNDWAVVVRRGH
jgi:hypothetical protein